MFLFFGKSVESRELLKNIYIFLLSKKELFLKGDSWVCVIESTLFQWFVVSNVLWLLSHWSVGTCAGLTVSLGGVTSQQLARPLRLEVGVGDVLAVAAVQHFLVPVLLHLLKNTQEWGCVMVFRCLWGKMMRGWVIKHTMDGSPASAVEPLRAESFGATAVREEDSEIIFKDKQHHCYKLLLL